MRTSLLVAVAATAIFIVAVPAMARAKDAGSPSPTQIKRGFEGGFYRPVNISDPHVQEIGRWAVAEHVKKANDGLTFNKVVSGQYLVIQGFNYRLIVDATDSHGRDANYEADVWEKEWENFRELNSFKPAN